MGENKLLVEMCLGLNQIARAMEDFGDLEPVRELLIDCSEELILKIRRIAFKCINRIHILVEKYIYSVELFDQLTKKLELQIEKLEILIKEQMLSLEEGYAVRVNNLPEIEEIRKNLDVFEDILKIQKINLSKVNESSSKVKEILTKAMQWTVEIENMFEDLLTI